MNKITLKKKIKEYFDVYLQNDENEVADIESFATFLGVTRDELLQMESEKDFGREISLAKSRIAGIKKQLAFKGKIPASVLAFDFKNNHGYKDRNDSEQTGTTLIIRGDAEKWSE